VTKGTPAVRTSESEPPIQAVPFMALSRQHAPLGDELREAFDRVMAADAFILGTEVDAFENDFAQFCEVEHCVGVASGTAALELALAAAGVGPGDEVIVPAHTFIATVLAVIHIGATPVFCDVEGDTGLIDPASAASVITGRTAAIVPVHLYGQACDMNPILATASRHGLFVLEDAAQAHGATYEGKSVGSLGDAAAFSFYPSKNLGALGDGGAVCTRDIQIAERIRELRHLGQRKKGEHRSVGRNERLDGLQAAFLRIKLGYLNQWNEARQQHAHHLHQVLPDDLTLLGERSASPCIYHLFPVRHRHRDDLASALRSVGIAVGLHYSPPAHLHPAFKDLPDNARPIPVPEAVAWAEEELSLPMFPELTGPELALIAENCASACAAIAAQR
jgi:dTDP-4-amino-4,6-dideoxygalactose transaminase